MKNFSYFRPKSLKEASGFVKKNPGALLFAGGTDVLGLLKDEVVDAPAVVNLKSVTGLEGIRYEAGKGLRIGALTRVADIAEHGDIRRHYPVLAEAAEEVASPQLRNVGTLGGNLCQRPRCWYFRGDFHCLRKGGDTCFAVNGENKYHCVIGGDPCFIVHPSDLAVALLALDARVRIFDGKRTKEISLSQFYVRPAEDVRRETALKPGEIVTEVWVPGGADGARSGYLKVKQRGSWDFAIVSVAAVLHTENGRVKSGKVAFGGVAPVPWEETPVNRALEGADGTEQALQKIAAQALKEATPLEQNAYKVPMARNALIKLLQRLLQG
jgi:xanthine dehydrogenase YagS FAD-binding subunit